MPKTAVYATAIAKVRNCTFLEILNTDENGLQVFCQICAKSFACSKSNHVGDHIGSQYYVKAANLKATKQDTLIKKNSGNQEEDFFGYGEPRYCSRNCVCLQLPFYKRKHCYVTGGKLHSS